jgi:hypothetical protein
LNPDLRLMRAFGDGRWLKGRAKTCTPGAINNAFFVDPIVIFTLSMTRWL